MTSNNSNNDNDLLDLAFRVKMLLLQARRESELDKEYKFNGRGDYNQGRVDACFVIFNEMREQLGLDKTEFNKRINGRLALRCLEDLLSPKSSHLTEKGWEVTWKDGRYVITYENGRFTSIMEEEYYTALNKK